ncbi:hypothetical protein ACKFKF_06565 [Phormidesmis sp. 146-12]
MAFIRPEKGFQCRCHSSKVCTECGDRGKSESVEAAILSVFEMEAIA